MVLGRCHILYSYCLFETSFHTPARALVPYVNWYGGRGGEGLVLRTGSSTEPGHSFVCPPWVSAQRLPWPLGVPLRRAEAADAPTLTLTL